MELTEKTRGLDSLYLQHVSSSPLEDREKIGKHCREILSDPTSKKYGDPSLFNLEEIDSYLTKASFSVGANYRDAQLTTWDQLILVAKKFAVNFFDDAKKAKRENIQRYQDVIKKISDDYKIDPTTDAGRKTFLTIVEQELAVRLHWFIKRDTAHSVASITALTPAGLHSYSHTKRFFLNVLLAEREDIYSYLGSEYRESLSSMYRRKGVIPDKVNVNVIIGFLASYAAEILEVEPKRLISSIAGISGGHGCPELVDVENFLNTIKLYCENSLSITNPSMIMPVISSITGMCNGRGLHALDGIETFLDEIKNYCGTKLYIKDPSKIISVISSITGMCGGHGMPAKGETERFLNEISDYCQTTLEIQDELVDFIKSTTSMLHCRGITEPGVITSFFQDVQKCCIEELKVEDPQIIARNIRHIMWMQGRNGIPEITRVRSFFKTVVAECQEKLGIESPDSLTHIFHCISWMQFMRGLPGQENLKDFFDTLAKYKQDSLTATNNLGIESLLDFVGSKRRGLGVVTSYDELKGLLGKHVGELSSFRKFNHIGWSEDIFDDTSDKRRVSVELFYELGKHSAALARYIPVLQAIWNVENVKISDKHKKRIMIRDFALKIKENPEQIVIYKKITKKTQANIINIANDYLNCRDALIMLHRGLVFYCFGKLHHVRPGDSDDLISIGKIALIEAVDRYDPKLGYEFSSYAFDYIRGKFLSYFNSKNSIFQLPSSVGDRIRQIKKVLAEQRGIDGTEDIGQVAEELNLDERTITNLLDVSRGGVLLSELDRSKKSNADDFFTTTKSDPVKQAEENDLGKYIRTSILTCLSERERLVVVQFFGLGGVRYTLDEISMMMNPPIGRERVRQIKDKALDKIGDAISRNPKLANEIQKLFSDEL